MVCSTVLFLLIFVGAVLGAPPATGVLFNIKDFQGNVFDLAFTSSADLAPVQTLNVKPGVSAQAWTLSSVGTLFTIANPFVGTFLSFTMAKNGLNPTCAQICGYTGVATAWNISANAVGLGYKFVAASGIRFLALTHHRADVQIGRDELACEQFNYHRAYDTCWFSPAS
ncbi:hypothetical protein B0H13DRAFT_1903910 [Mycena leptocephala]|nr:hypothetical protein B0H13DRAFT_1903910 [Mycena leptocephala]